MRDLAKHEKELKDLGADEVLSSISDDVPARVKEITGVHLSFVGFTSISNR